MAKHYDFNYIVIGSGPAGRTIAMSLAKAKKSVAIVEGRSLGGSDLNSRDIPYAASLDFSHSVRRIQDFQAVSHDDFHFNFPTVVSRQDYISSIFVDETKKSLEDSKVTIINGYAHFLNEHEIAVGNNKYTANSFILATGSHLKTSEISRVDSVNFLTPDTALKIRRLPKFVFIVGGGSTGCEIAAYYAELGTKVIIMERSTRLLPREDKEVSVNVTKHLEENLGVRVITGTKVVAIEQDDISKRVIFAMNGEEKFVRVDCIVLATGSQPNTDLGLENAGVKYKRSGIIVDKLFQTSSKNIYAIGDCLGSSDSSTERAEYEATILASNLIHKTKNQPNYSGFARSINLSTEVTTVGLNEYDLLARDLKYKKSIVEIKEIPASKIYEQNIGFVKLIIHPNGTLAGATIMAPHASSMIGELALAVRGRLSLNTLLMTPRYTNDYSYAIKLAIKKLVK